MRLRPLLFWAHLTTGAAAGIVIVILSASGGMLALQPQILAWLERGARTVRPPDGRARLGPGALLAAAQAARPGSAPASLTIDVDRGQAASVNFGPDGMIFVDPYSGRMLGSGAAAARAAFQSVTEWHRWLGASGAARPAARAVTGAANLAFCLLAISGLFLWWPRTWTWRAVRPVVLFQRMGTPRARDFNWHNVIGFWCAPVLIVLTATGVVMSYPWANALVYRLAGTPLPGVAGSARPAAADAAGSMTPTSLDRAWAIAESRVPTWQTITVRFPSRAGAPLALSIVDGAYWNAFARSNLTVDPATAEIVRWDPYDQVTRGQKMRGWIRFAHTGELAGAWGQLAAGGASLGGLALVCTGLSLAIRRLAASRIFRPARSASSGAESRVVDAR